MPEPNPTFTIPREIIDPIIQAQVGKAITEALGGREMLIDKAISYVLTQKVDERGNRDTYNSSNSHTWLQWVMGECIRQAAKQAIMEVMTKHKEMVAKAMVEQLRNSRSPLAKQFAESLLTGIAGDAQRLEWRLKIEFSERG